MFSKYHKSSGNIIFLILIAIVLFAALAFAFTQGGRVQGDTSPRERSKLVASQILGFAGNVDQSITRARVTYGCDPKELRFSYDALPAGYVNTTATPLDKTCYIFDSIGEKLPYQTPPSTSLQDSLSGATDFDSYVFSGANTVENVGAPGVPQLVMFLPHLREDVCKQINVVLNINLPTGTPINDANGVMAVGASSYFSGTYTNTAHIDAGGLKAACLVTSDIGEGAGDPHYVFFQVISQR